MEGLFKTGKTPKGFSKSHVWAAGGEIREIEFAGRSYNDLIQNTKYNYNIEHWNDNLSYMLNAVKAKL